MKILIAGTGGIGSRHVHCFKDTQRCEVAICDLRSEQILKIASRYSIEETYLDFKSIDLRKFDGVVIATPPSLHVSMGMACAKVNVPFLLEKPVALKENSVSELIRLCQKKKVTCGVAFPRIHMKVVKKGLAQVKRGIIGQLKMATFFMGHDFRKYRPDYACNYYAKRDTGGGIIMDALSHHIDLVLKFIGRVESISAMYDRLDFKGVECEDSAVVILRHTSGVLSSLCGNQFQKPMVDRFEFIGTKGNMVIDAVEKTLNICRTEKNKWQTKSFPEDLDARFVAQAHNFLDTIEGKTQIATSLKEGLEVLRICNTILGSGQKGKRLMIEKQIPQVK